MRSLAPLAIAAALVISLSGCFANPVESIIEKTIEEQTGVDVEVNSEGNGASLPSSWPAEVPVPSGTILASFGIDGSYSATIEVSDEAAGQAGLDTLVAQGFEITSEADFGGLKSYTLASDALGVTYAWGDDGNGTVVVNMGVTSRTS